MRESRPFRARLLLAASAGLLHALAHPPAGWWPLVFVAALPLLLAIERDGEVPGDGRRNLVVGLVAGFAFFLPDLFWITHTTHVFGGVPWVGVVPVWFAFAAVFSVDFAAMCWALGRTTRLGPGVGLALFPLVWAAHEWVRSVLWTGFPWLLSAHALVARPELLFPSTLGGVLFLSAMVAAVPAALLAVGRDLGGRRSLAGFVALLFVAGLFAAGVVRFRLERSRTRRSRPTATMRVAVVPPNIPQGIRWSSGEEQRIWQELLAQTETLEADGPELVVWPESALPWELDDAPWLKADVQGLARRLGASILVNTIRTEASGEYFNSARVVAPDGTVSEAYDKRHLVPFGEYVPAKWIFGWAGKIVRGIGDFRPGREARPLEVGIFREGERVQALVGVAVCYEAVYPDVFRDGVRSGANLVATMTNDDWYGGLGAEDQHWNGAVAAAVASGRSLARGAITGISGITAPDGEVLARIPLGEKGVRVATVPLRDDETPATRIGDWFGRGAFVASLCAILLASRLRKGPAADGGGA